MKMQFEDPPDPETKLDNALTPVHSGSQGPGITGIWKGTHEYRAHGRPKMQTQLVVFQQHGERVLGTAIAGEKHRHRIEGDMRHSQYFTGRWTNILEGMNYHGAFQLIVHNEGDKMWGKWVGYDRENKIQHGLWIWKLLTRDITKSPQDRLLEEADLSPIPTGPDEEGFDFASRL